ncbi:MAG: preprotein translocase subunit SecE [Desulfobacteraceae bacterium]|nr:preprotein translocase subunit SecE [Desulfobacteraceae bacterium]
MSSKDAEIASKKKGPDAEAKQPSKFSPAQIKQFAGEVKTEFGKIGWPDKKHTMGSTVVVVVLVIIISFYLGAVDLVLGKIVSSILG